MAELDVVGEAAEEGDTLADEDRKLADDEAPDEPRAQEVLDGLPPVDIEVPGAAGSQLGDDILRRAGPMFHHRPPGPRRA